MDKLPEKFYVDVSGRSLLAMEGPDGLDLLQRISTNDVSRVAVGEHVGTVLTTEKGRVIDIVTVFRTAKDRLVISGTSGGVDHLRSWIEGFIITENVRLESLADSHFQFLVFNTSNMEVSSYITEDNILLAQLKYMILPNSILVGPREAKERIVSVLAAKSFERLTESDYESFRVAKGIPEHAHEISEQFNPLEIGLQSLVSFSKGCYVGQEVIARLDTYQKVQRSLWRLRLTDAPSTLPCALMTIDGTIAGILTSYAATDAGFLGLGVVRRGLGSDELRYAASLGTMPGKAELLT